MLELSPLPHTWLLDLDGSIVFHKSPEDFAKGVADKLTPKAAEFFATLPKNDIIIILTARPRSEAGAVERFLKEHQIRFNQIIYDLPAGERILVNDSKPSGLLTAHAVNLPRDGGLDIDFKINEAL